MNKTKQTQTQMERRLSAVRGEGWVEKVKGQSKHINKTLTDTDHGVVMPEGGRQGRQRGGRG